MKIRGFRTTFSRILIATLAVLMTFLLSTGNASDVADITESLQTLGAHKLHLKDGELSYVNLRGSRVADADLSSTFSVSTKPNWCR